MRIRNIIFIIILCFELALILFFSIKKSNHCLKGYIGLISCVLLFIASTWLMLFPGFKEIKPTGKYEVNVETITMIDDTRIETFTNDNSKRALEVKFWYPKDATEEGKSPLVVFSHGSFGTVDNNQTLMMELASRGYVVASIGHTYLAYEVNINGKKISMNSNFRKEIMRINPNKNKEEAFELFSKWMDLTTKDASFVIDSIKSKSDGFYKLIDKTKICMMGHSFGGSTALGIGRIRNDIYTVVALESPFMYDVKGVKDNKFIFDETIYPTRMLNIYSDSSYSKLGKWDQYSQNYKYLNYDSKYKNVHIGGIGHMHLCDFQLVSPFLSWVLSGIDTNNTAKENLRKLNEIILVYFKEINF